MDKKEYLDEKKYKKASNGLFFAGIGMILVAVAIIIVAIVATIPGNEVTSGGQLDQLNQQLVQSKSVLEERYAELEAMGVRKSSDYRDKDGFEMNQIDIVLNPKYDYCEQTTAYVKNDTTQEYCSIKAQIYNITKPDIFENPTLPIGIALVCALPCFGIGLGLIMMAKRRNIMAYHAQQSMPIIKETTEELAPTAGVVAKEVAKGIKEGLKDEPGKKAEKNRG